MRKKEENPIKKFIYKHKKIFKYLLLLIFENLKNIDI